MNATRRYFKSTVTALVLSVTFSLPSSAQEQAATDKMADLFARLATAESPADARRIEREIRFEWSKSGSPAMDLLLKRGNDALEVNEVGKAIEHFTALTDHAPDFAEGWHGLAQAYYRNENFGIAMDALERVLTLNPDHFGALRGVAAVLEQVEQPDEAYEIYSRIHAISPQDEDVNAALERLRPMISGRTL